MICTRHKQGHQRIDERLSLPTSTFQDLVDLRGRDGGVRGTEACGSPSLLGLGVTTSGLGAEIHPVERPVVVELNLDVVVRHGHHARPERQLVALDLAHPVSTVRVTALTVEDILSIQGIRLMPLFTLKRLLHR